MVRDRRLRKVQLADEDAHADLIGARQAIDDRNASRVAERLETIRESGTSILGEGRCPGSTADDG